MSSGAARWVSDRWVRHPLIAIIVGVLLAGGAVASGLQAKAAVGYAEALEAGDYLRITGELDGHTRRQKGDNDADWWIKADGSGDTDRSERFDMGASADRELRDHVGDTVTGYRHDGKMLAVELPDGEVVEAQTVGYSGVAIFAVVGLVLLSAGVLCGCWGVGSAVARGAVVNAPRAGGRHPPWVRPVGAVALVVMLISMLAGLYLIFFG